jgi:hypothetical protein
LKGSGEEEARRKKEESSIKEREYPGEGIKEQEVRNGRSELRKK